MGYSDDKPPCYGDAETYDPEDDTCQECAVRASCGIRASSPRSSGYS